jgi:hypothetical protein
MIGLLKGGVAVDEGRAGRGFVPHVESLEGRVVPGYGRVKIEFEVANPEVPAQVSTLPPPAADLAAPQAEANGVGLVQLPGSGESGFNRGDGTGFELAKTDKDKFEFSLVSVSTNGAGQDHGVWVGSGPVDVTVSKASPKLF